jgi:hypothetical protein
MGKIIFYTKKETEDFHQSFSHLFVQSFTRYDLLARNVMNINMYIQRILESGLEWSKGEKERIVEGIYFVENWCRNHRRFIYETWNIDIEKLEMIPWIFMKMGKMYECGLPHTRGERNIISIPDDFCKHRETIQDISKTLLHEKIHLYQRLHEKEMIEYMKKRNIYCIKDRQIYYFPRRRFNPDLDGNAYFHMDKKILYGSHYKDEPKHLMDVRYPEMDKKNEHPFEEMAYEIEDYFYASSAMGVF